MSTPFVSIIIPTFNDSKRLQHCLSLLENQTYPKHFYEVIVVDNNSSDDIAQVVAEFEHANYAFEPTPGSYIARNKALTIAKGEILGFTDSDCASALDWIEQGVAQVLAHPGCGFVAGRIDFSFEDPENPTAAELYDSMHFLRQEKYVREANFGVTANLFTTPQMFEAVGVFDATLKSGGDSEWGKRVHAAGYSQFYAENVIVTHPARSDLKTLIRKQCRVHQGKFITNHWADLPVSEFAVRTLLDLKPPARYLLEILRNEDIKDLRKRLMIVYIYMYLRVRKATISLRLYCT